MMRKNILAALCIGSLIMIAGCNDQKASDEKKTEEKSAETKDVDQEQTADAKKEDKNQKKFMHKLQ